MDFPQFRDIHHLIPQVLDLTRKHTTECDYHYTEDADNWEIYVKYRKIVSRFLIDHFRSDIGFYSWSGGQDHYVSFAKYLLSFLSERLW